MATFPCDGVQQVSFAQLKESYETEKVELEKLFEASEQYLAEMKGRVQEFKPCKDTLDDLSTKVEEREHLLKLSEGHVRFLEDDVS